MSSEFREQFLDYLCRHTELLYTTFVFGVILLFLSVISLALGASGGAALIASANIVLLLTILVPSLYALYLCKNGSERREKR